MMSKGGKNSKTTIRASSLPQYPDCERRYAARSFSEQVKAAGYELKTMLPSIGAIIGTGTHEALGYAMLQKMEGQEIVKADMEALAVASIEDATKDGVVWDQTTTNMDAAIVQAIRQAKIILQTVGKDINPVAVEDHFKANLGDGFELSGHIDIREINGIADFKTGSVQRANQTQYGGYSLLAKSNGHKVERLREIYVPRVGKRVPQPDPIVTEYGVAVAEKGAAETIKHIKSGLIKFKETGENWIFLPNPNSMMCSPNYCPAFGTKFCQSHKNIKGK
ncbi:PD-(D/E)XK nuclease family protein [uncultured Kiloniella sp.]|uniref:PD-(D/E)XK nuclease family protein n=1 Tax=uncultured Kiloniella sp. TaxID=1133091 RepID=UPI0026083EEC|nr:PD-(D/E)XK nuclease family protein [uncultured Kiloniella sp.]